VFLMQQLHFSLSTVTTLWVSSQLANAVVLYIWGRLSDRFSNKAVLAVAVPAYFLCVLGLVFAALPEREDVRLGIFYAVHIAMGAASGGIALATGNMSLKLAPQGQGTAYLAATSLVASVSGGIAPILGGALAELLETAQVSVLVRWAWPGSAGEATVIEFAHWQFLFLVSVALGMYVLHALSRIREGEEVSERVVMQQFALEALRTVNQLSTVAGLLGNLIAFNRLIERRVFGRRSTAKSPTAGTPVAASKQHAADAASVAQAAETPEPAPERRATPDRRAEG
jgi:MFS family permease